MAVAFLSTSKAGIGKEAQAAAKIVTPVNGGLLSEAAASQAMRSLRPPTPSSRCAAQHLYAQAQPLPAKHARCVRAVCVMRRWDPDEQHAARVRVTDSMHCAAWMQVRGGGVTT